MKEKMIFFKNLDALRFFAFLGVFNSHLLPAYDNSNGVHFTDFLYSAFSFAYLGVPFFFTLSSFLITYRLLYEDALLEKIHLQKFYLKRGLRIWPIYFLLIIICFLFIPMLMKAFFNEAPTLPNILPFLFFYSNFYMIDHGMHFISALTVLWSLAIEEQFYIFWGAIMKFLQRYLVWVAIVLLLASVTFCYYYLCQLKGEPANLRIHSFYALPNFCFGALIARACYYQNQVFQFLKSLPGLLYLLVYLSLAGFYTLQNLGVLHFDIVFTAVFNSICYGLILFDQTFNEKRFFNAGRFKFINYLGKISYGLYIYHLLIFSIVLKAFTLLIPFQNMYVTTARGLITLLLTIGTAHISYRGFEKYFLRLKEKISSS